MIFGIKEKSIILTHAMAIATNIPQRLKTAFVVQAGSHIWETKWENLQEKGSSWCYLFFEDKQLFLLCQLFYLII